MEKEMIGLYARTNTGKIFRFAWVENEKYILIITKSEYGYLNYEKYWLEKDEEIVKHSKNIIDLLEVGDYVNGYKVIGVTLDPAPSGKCVDIDCDKPSYESYLFEEQIYSIVTHEQFTSMEYKVGE